MTTTILITGATGQVGGELLGRLLMEQCRGAGAESGTGTIALLVRAADDAAALERAREACAWALSSGCDPDDRACSEAARAQAGTLLAAGLVRAVRGSIDAPGLGLAPAERAALVADLGEVFHCAASTRFEGPIEELRRTNVAGTEAVLELAREAARGGRLVRFHHVSTAYVGGAAAGTFRETDAPLVDAARNSYERSKGEAEARVRASGLPFRIYRPSVIVGDSRTGRTRAFNVVYVPMRLAWNDRLRVLPARPDAVIDVVPVDFVADALLALARAGGSTLDGTTFHLVSGAPTPLPALVVGLADALDRARAARCLHPIRRPHLVAPDAVRAPPRTLAPYMPYLSGTHCRFDAALASGVLEPLGVRPPPLSSYVDRLVEYAISRGFSSAT